MKYINKKNIKWYITKLLSNLNLSIIMLLFIAAISMIGTVIVQDQSINYYQLHYPISHHIIQPINWKVIIDLGLDHIYATWWFILILILFFCSLITCTFSRQLPALRNARNWKFMPETNKAKYCTSVNLFKIESLTNIISSLNSKYYYVFHKKNRIYSYKGLVGRIAPVFVHISIILTLTGSMAGFFGGFTTQQMIPSGELFHIQNIIKSGLQSSLPKDLLGRVENFYIEYNQDNSIKQFYSDILLLNHNGRDIIRKKIYVNSPLIFNNITLYQTDWQIDSLRIKIDSNTIEQKLKKTKLGNTYIWICNLPLNNIEQIFFIITSLNDKILIYNSSGNLITSINLHKTIKINSKNITIEEIMTSTGLQIKTDPGLPIVYIGFLILMISVVVSYLSYSQIWISCVSKKKQSLSITGITNRAKLSFEEDFICIQKAYSTFSLAVYKYLYDKIHF
uniref:Cytochrome c biogenesis protein CcsB n=1 Tax=Mastocarpus papillatus TaxID=31436 RepID=A0A342RZA9_9FLOR|nr:cytochrome c biogenesis protein ccs1 [Mastocarpus papillatus]AOL58055.1 cytochrome c biogenesis protein ccs1 [Mastocarpus papillatus]